MSDFTKHKDPARRKNYLARSGGIKNKEGKYYGYPSGVTTEISNLDEREFTVQGLGTASLAHSSPSLGETIKITVANNTSTSYVGADGSGDTWDSTAD